ncbi:MAG: hypothetical protein ACYCTI_00005, partial [Acidimicrobiales bacterium]
YFVPGGIDPEKPFLLGQRPSLHPSRRATDLVIAANFVEVFLAEHSGESDHRLNPPPESVAAFGRTAQRDERTAETGGGVRSPGRVSEATRLRT